MLLDLSARIRATRILRSGQTPVVVSSIFLPLPGITDQQHGWNSKVRFRRAEPDIHSQVQIMVRLGVFTAVDELIYAAGVHIITPNPGWF